jgi:hypothetical protein
MPDFGTEMAQVIADMVAAGRPAVTKMGTVATRELTGTRATVVFDGSSGTAQPVKCFESVVVGVGDRVGLIRYEADWIITGNYTGRGLADVSGHFQFSSLTQITSGSYVDMPSSPGVSYVKTRDSTIMRFAAGVSAYGSNAANGAYLGLRITSSDLVTDYDQDIRKQMLNRPSADVHVFWSGVRNASSAHPAGAYTATARWYRYSGTGFIQVDAEDSVWIECREVWP